MQAQILSGYEVQYKTWSDFKTFTVKIPGAVKYKLKPFCLYSEEWRTGFYFINKKNKVIFSVRSKVAVLSIREIVTTELVEAEITFIDKIKNLIKTKFG